MRIRRSTVAVAAVLLVLGSFVVGYRESLATAEQKPALTHEQATVVEQQGAAGAASAVPEPTSESVVDGPQPSGQVTQEVTIPRADVRAEIDRGAGVQESHATPGPQRELTPEQRALVEQKNAARVAAGIPEPGTDPFVQGPQPSRQFTQEVTITRAEVQAQIDREVEINQPTWDYIEQRDGRAAAEAAMADFISRRWADKFPHPPGIDSVTVTISGVEVGTRPQ